MKQNQNVYTEKAIIKIQNPENYIQIPDTNTVIAINETHNNMNYENTHKAVLTDGFFIPTLDLWSKHLTSVIEAYKGNTTLYDAKGNPFPQDKLAKLYGELTRNCWAWLNARFPKGNGFNNLDLETITGINQGNLVTKIEPLEECLMQDCYVTLDFTSQGLPIKELPIQEYIQGENILYWHPIENSVARFLASSDWAGLLCNRLPQYSDSVLGVRAAKIKA